MLLEKSENLNEEKNKPSPLSHNKHKKLLQDRSQVQMYKLK